MRKFILLVALLFTSALCNAQATVTYGLADSIYLVKGTFTAKSMYSMKDSSNTNTDSYFFKFHANNVHFVKHFTKNDGAPNGVLWLDASNGKLKRSPISELYNLTDSKYLGLTANASSATKLITARNINGVSFDGTTDITIPQSKRQETYTGTTSGSGTYTVTYTTAYSVTPNVQFNINGGTTTNTARLTASSATGFTITANNRVEVLGLLPTYPTLNGLVVDLLVTEK